MSLTKKLKKELAQTLHDAIIKFYVKRGIDPHTISNIKIEVSVTTKDLRVDYII